MDENKIANATEIKSERYCCRRCVLKLVYERWQLIGLELECCLTLRLLAALAGH